MYTDKPFRSLFTSEHSFLKIHYCEDIPGEAAKFLAGLKPELAYRMHL